MQSEIADLFAAKRRGAARRPARARRRRVLYIMMIVCETRRFVLQLNGTKHYNDMQIAGAFSLCSIFMKH